MVKEAVLINGISELAIMKLDVLDGLKTIKVCVAYKYKGKKLCEFPYDTEVLKNAKPVYKEIPGWNKTAFTPRSYRELPRNAKLYLDMLNDFLKTKISMVSVGSSREDTIFK
jgi:adenylosuccinate synthase